MFEEKLLEPHFTSVLAPYMLDVVEQKRALGNKYHAGVEALSAFDDFCNEQQLRIPAPKQQWWVQPSWTAMSWRSGAAT